MAGYGIYQVEYSIDGNDHVGFILGSFNVGQQVQLKAPADGSPYERLALADSMLSKILSWLFMAIGLALAVGGAVWLTRGMIARSAQIRADVRRTYGLPATSAPTLAGRPPAGPPPSRISADGSVPPRGFFTAPYDI